jgi:predicted ATP-binding protein involved in virulence
MFLKLTKFPYVASLEIEQVKCFKEKQILKFTDENNRPYRWTVLLGDNGTGKTTILRSLLLASQSTFSSLISPSLTERIGTHDYVEQLNVTENSVIKFHYINSYDLENTHIQIQFENINDKGDKKIRSIIGFHGSLGVTDDSIFFGYSANRIGNKGTSFFEENLEDKGNLIDEDAKLIDVERYFLDADHFAKTKKNVKSESELVILKQMLLSILPEVDDLRISTQGRSTRLEFLTPYGWVKFSDMSLGYRTITAWMVDLAVKMFLASPRSKNPLEQPAVVFVDEIDLHMHPQWQQKIIHYLTKKFPKTQFIVTAHSPLIVQSATDANVIVLKRKGNQVVVEKDPISVKNWRIDQILSSDLFGVSTRNLEVTQKMNRRKVLLLKDRLNSVEKKELSHLQKEVGNLPATESPEMIEAMNLIIKTAKNLKK